MWWGEAADTRTNLVIVEVPRVHLARNENYVTLEAPQHAQTRRVGAQVVEQVAQRLDVELLPLLDEDLDAHGPLVDGRAYGEVADGAVDVAFVDGKAVRKRSEEHLGWKKSEALTKTLLYMNAY